MTSRDDGVIKYDCDWHKTAEVDWPHVAHLDSWRSRCFDHGLVGVYPDGVGYGNVSARIEDSQEFWITGSATGALRRLSVRHYTRVVGTDPALNRVVCTGPIQASSESMTHAAVYATLPRTRAVLHVHSRRLWDALIDHAPTTARDVLYGTPTMVEATVALLREPSIAAGGVFVMGGHQDGLVVFGDSLDEAGQRLLALAGAPLG